ncbi:MAG TPA: dolichyl-phosphate beta-glucosyltransferase [Myxococcaceae bacterium]|nr:dolichyl-phosphate beta-glucosyltransferase [Myxococcaceae bacterium]
MTPRVVTFATSQPEPKRSTHAARLRRLSIVIPALNEERRLPETLAIIERWCQLNLERAEIIVVDDGSADRTADVARELGARCQPSVTVRVLRNALNRGKGASVRAGVLSAAEPYILMTDADLSTPIEEMEKLAAAIDDSDVAIGSRAARGADIQVHQPFHREMMGKTFNKLVQLLVTGGIRDTQCGFKLFRREVAQQIFSRTVVDRFAFDVEALYVARKLGYRIEEVPVVWRNSSASTVDPLRDAARMLLDLFRIRRLHRTN